MADHGLGHVLVVVAETSAQTAGEEDDLHRTPPCAHVPRRRASPPASALLGPEPIAQSRRRHLDVGARRSRNPSPRRGAARIHRTVPSAAHPSRGRTWRVVDQSVPVKPPMPSIVSPARRSRLATVTTSHRGAPQRRDGGVAEQRRAADRGRDLQVRQMERRVEHVEWTVAHLVVGELLLLAAGSSSWITTKAPVCGAAPSA